jgi:catechol 2,3-dioxygenase-like lactoylglutathione lyase family enzyme
MPKIKHIAISTQDVDKTAKFYIEVFGMKEIAKVDSPAARGYYLSDGDLNLAILNFKNDAAAGVERGKGWNGIHHIGFQVESLDAIAEKLAAAGSEPRDDVNEALGVGRGRRHGGNVEVKYGGPDGVMLDVSETGWVGTPTLNPS